MNLKEAVKESINIVNDLLNNPGSVEIKNLLLEEVKFNEQENIWEVTVSFAIPNYQQPSQNFASLFKSPEPTFKREYRLVKIDNHSGEVKSMNNRMLKEANHPLQTAYLNSQ